MINSVGNKTNQNDLYKNRLNKTQSELSENKTATQYTKLRELDKLQNKEIVNFLRKITEEITKAEFIATKVIKGEDVSKEEQNFIIKKHPYVKKIIEETINEHSELKNKMDECKSNSEKELIIQNLVKSIQNLKDETIYSKLTVKLKMIILEDIKIYNQTVKNELEIEAKKYEEKDNLNDFYMSIYYNLQNIFLKPANILILIIIIVATIVLFI